MMNNSGTPIELPATGFALGYAEGAQGMNDFTWASTLMMLFFAHAGPMPNVESIDDLKKAISDFNDSVQAMELPKLEVSTDEV